MSYNMSSRVAMLFAALQFSLVPSAFADTTLPTPSPSIAPASIATPNAPGKLITVPAGLAVTCHVSSQVDSGSARDGDTFEIRATDNVVVDGYVVIAKDAIGQGMVVASKGSGGNGHGGSLQYQFSYIVSIDGGKIKLSPTMQTKVEPDRKGASSTATIVGFATLGIGGLFGHNLARGHQSVIDQKTPLSAFVADTVHVTSSLVSTEDRYDK